MKTHDPKIFKCSMYGNPYRYEKLKHGENKEKWYIEGTYYKLGIFIEFFISSPFKPNEKIEGHMFANTPWGISYMSYELKKEYSRKGLANILSAFAKRILTFEIEY